jgi:hypothetical protein
VPEQTVEAPAEALTLHEVRAGDAVELDFPRERASGTYLVAERADSYSGNTLETDLTFQEIESV